MKTLHSKRICTIDEGIYMIIDYFPEIDGQPMICIIQINEDAHKKAQGERIKLPGYLRIEKDITDLVEFQPWTMSRHDYKMDPELV